MVSGILAVGLAFWTAVPASAATPLFIGWTGLLPPLPTAYTPADVRECTDGDPRCVDATIARMQNRYDPLAASCDHNAVFALTYLRTTEEYRRVAAQPGFFQDVSHVNTEDAVFAAYYFHAYDSWRAGGDAEVPAAWRIAFDAAAGRRLAGAGNILLGMNAHVNRDLPFVLASLGLVSADGRSHKPDHDKVNVMLNQVVDPLLREAADRFDPSIDNIATPLGLSYTVLMQLLVTWREAAWRNAERLVNAPTAEARARVEKEIETAAAVTATTLRTVYSVPGLLPLGQDRNVYCMARS
ncbi:hypothetical protein CC117_17395 [Parafrankia colletiae]|uniref:Uncharacterized protein n=1 Tax=Parafrankia colletiae TaxID=573497 RepID=A0A1S1QTB1_9ACTN|nr:DUF5995 family protein [Parafrankia colletiae]MCK9903681.1 DUF5995 family protein [Frankia sp. Cpl3]OHV36671.1 hypothetical protein CC117_17395 [Parafrankia colletiae]